jgi:hypothetical protein
MDQRKRIEQIVQNKLPGSKVIFHDEEGLTRSADESKALRVAQHFGWDHSEAEIIILTLVESSGRSLPRMCIVAAQDISDERLLRVLGIMS